MKSTNWKEFAELIGISAIVTSLTRCSTEIGVFCRYGLQDSHKRSADMTRSLVLSSACFFSSVSVAHHSISSLYDYNDIVEMEGTLKSISWINPHVHLIIETTRENGEPELWELEGSTVNLLQFQQSLRR